MVTVGEAIGLAAVPLFRLEVGVQLYVAPLGPVGLPPKVVELPWQMDLLAPALIKKAVGLWAGINVAFR